MDSWPGVSINQMAMELHQDQGRAGDRVNPFQEAADDHYPQN